MEKNELLQALEAAFLAKNQEELQNLARTAVETYEEEAFGYAYLAESFLMGDYPIYANAENCLVKAAEYEPNEIQHLLRFAEIKEKQADYANAYLLYSKALDIDDTDITALMSCGLFQSRQMEDCDAAMFYFDKVIALDEDNVVAHFARAEALASAERYEAALADLGFVLERGFHESAAILKINILENLNQYPETVSLRKALVAARPDFPGYAYTCGRTLMSLGNYEEAETYLSKSLALLKTTEQPLDRNLLDDLSIVLLHLEQYQRTIETIDSLIATAETVEVTAYIRRAEAKIGLNDFEGAKKDLKIAEKDEFWADEIKLQEANVLAAQGDFAGAEAIYKPLTEKSSSNRPAALGMAKSFFKQNKLAEAYKWAKFAHRKNYMPATSYINSQLKTYLAETRQALLAQNTAFEATNTASPAAQKLFSGVWVFDSLKSKKMENMPPDGMETLRAMMADFCMIFSPSGMFIFSPPNADSFIYKIEKQGADLLQIQMLPIDGAQPQTVKIKVEGDTMLFSREEGEFFKMKKLAATALNTQTKQRLKEQTPKSQVDFLGAEVDKMIYG